MPKCVLTSDILALSLLQKRQDTPYIIIICDVICENPSHVAKGETAK